jgi:hypothetical protein
MLVPDEVSFDILLIDLFEYSRDVDEVERQMQW